MAWWKRFELGIFALALVSLLAFAGHGGLWPSLESGELARTSETALRMPGALAAALAAVVLAWSVSRTTDARTGIWAGVVYATMPLVFENARIATGQWLVHAQGTLGFSLAIVLLWGRGGRALRLGALATLGGVCLWSMHTAGAGAVSFALAGAAGAGALRWRDEGSAEKRFAVLSAVGALVLGAVAWRSLHGVPAVTTTGPLGFDALAESVGHAVFPWTPVMAIGVARLALEPGSTADEATDRSRARESGIRLTALVTLVVGYIAQSWAAQRVGLMMFAAPAPLALATALCLRDAERSERPWPLAAFGVAAGIGILARDLALFPRVAFAALALPVAHPDLARATSASSAWLFAGLALFALVTVVAWSVPSSRRNVRALIPLAATVAAAFAMHGYLPRALDLVSPGPAWQALARVRAPGDEVAMLSTDVRAFGAGFYAADRVTPVGDEARAVAWLRGGTQRRFLIADVARLAALNHAFRASGAGTNVPLVATGPSGALLAVSNGRGLALDNPLDAVVSSARNDESRSGNAVFDDAIELLGTDVSPVAREISAGGHIDLTYRFRVKRAVSNDWHTFVHVDGACPRINGDHEGAGGAYPIADWLPGDIVLDHQRISVPIYCRAGEYTVYIGFFRGDHRMTVQGGEHDGENRVIAARVRVR